MLILMNLEFIQNEKTEKQMVWLRRRRCVWDEKFLDLAIWNNQKKWEPFKKKLLVMKRG
jgi:hypothetical protein